MGVLLVLAIRLTLPLTILRWPFWGTIVTILADTVDIIIFQLTEFPGSEYQRFDKAVDAYYIVLQVIVVQRWESPARAVLNTLVAYRAVAMIAYEISGTRELLVLFPNVFTFYFLFVAGVREFRPQYQLTLRRNLLWVAALALPTLLLEYALHGARWFDHWRAVDVIDEAIDAFSG